MQQDFNNQSKPEGKRAGVKATEIADTIQAVLAYFEETKQAFPTLLDAIRKEATGWQNGVASLRGADQATVDGFFGQPAPKDVRQALADAGVRKKEYGEPGFEDYNRRFCEMWDKMQGNMHAYWPGSITSSLDDYRDILLFDSYREKLDGAQDGPATRLIGRIDAFEGNRGSKHLALTHLMHETYAYVGNTPRHPSEIYVAPAGVEPDYLNAFHHTYSTHIDWYPSDDMKQVTAHVCNGTGELPEKKYKFLAYEQAKAAAALERGGISADVRVELGRTYAEDAVVITMSMEDYTRRYLPILRGKIKIDRSVPGSQHEGMLSTVENYPGYEPGKKAFFYGQDLLVSPGMVKNLSADFPAQRFLGPAEALDFLRETKHLVETREEVTVAPGRKEEFTRFKPVSPLGGGRKVYELEGIYYSDCDLHNQINRSLREIEAGINRRQPKMDQGRTQEKPDDVWFEHNGDMYLPRGDKYYQVALHTQHKYGADYTWVFRDKEGEKKAAGKDKYVLSTGALDPSVRDAALADIREWLKQDWNAKDIRSATVLRHKVRVGKPLNFAPKQNP